MVDLATAELVARYSKPIDAFIQAADRTRYESSLFDMRRRTLLGQYCLADHLVWFLREVTEPMPPAELARSMRRLASIPYGQLIHAMPWTYLVPRENDIALGRWPRGEGLDDDSLAWLMDTGRRWRSPTTTPTSSSCRPRPGNTQRFLPDGDDRGHPGPARRGAVRHPPTPSARSPGSRCSTSSSPARSAGATTSTVPTQPHRRTRTWSCRSSPSCTHRHQPWVQDLLGYPIDNVVCIRETAAATSSCRSTCSVSRWSSAAAAPARTSSAPAAGDHRGRRRRGRWRADELEDLAQAHAAVDPGRVRAVRELGRRLPDRLRRLPLPDRGERLRRARGRAELVDRAACADRGEHPDRLAEVRAMDDVAPVWARWREGRGFSPPA